MDPRDWRGRGDSPRESIEAVAERAARGLRGLGPRPVLTVLLGLVLVILLFSTWYTVQPEETAVVQRFGKVVRTAGPGLHFKLPYGLERVRHVPTARVLKEEFGFRTAAAGERSRYSPQQFEEESLMLTGDLNVIDVEWILQYRIEDPVLYLFRIREPRQTLRDLSESIMRRVVGNRLGSDVLTVGRVAVSTEVKEEMQKVLTDYETGIRLVTVELQDVTPPDPVKPAFNQVNEARQDKERRINQAQEQANREIPKARGEAIQAITQSEGYALERVNRARGEAERFQAVLAEYRQAREVTRRRLYLEALGVVLPQARAVYIVDGEQKALVPWLGLESGAAARPAGGPPPSPGPPSSAGTPAAAGKQP
ncbi:MAG: FtsH protease activity modulator HflK [Candidatus Rokuibacteriota bacterium]